ncbi:MAG: D-glycero-beta-D-manno-heptose 1-phosphate adenylyltransferase [Bacteroidota bacterium]
MQKILSLTELQRKVAAWRVLQDEVVFTNGCFDLLHIGHLRYLQAARKLGDHLIIGLNTDASVRQLKGPHRPILPQAERAEMLAALACVDAVVLFAEETPLSLINSLRPDILVKGADYTKAKVIGAPEVESWGGRVELIAFEAGYSTTALIDRIRQG